jgi:hypothetical protein
MTSGIGPADGANGDAFWRALLGSGSDQTESGGLDPAAVVGVPIACADMQAHAGAVPAIALQLEKAPIGRLRQWRGQIAEAVEASRRLQRQAIDRQEQDGAGSPAARIAVADARLYGATGDRQAALLEWVEARLGETPRPVPPIRREWTFRVAQEQVAAAYRECVQVQLCACGQWQEPMPEWDWMDVDTRLELARASVEQAVWRIEQDALLRVCDAAATRFLDDWPAPDDTDDDLDEARVQQPSTLRPAMAPCHRALDVILLARGLLNCYPAPMTAAPIQLRPSTSAAPAVRPLAVAVDAWVARGLARNTLYVQLDRLVALAAAVRPVNAGPPYENLSEDDQLFLDAAAAVVRMLDEAVLNFGLAMAPLARPRGRSPLEQELQCRRPPEARGDLPANTPLYVQRFFGMADTLTRTGDEQLDAAFGVLDAAIENFAASPAVAGVFEAAVALRDGLRDAPPIPDFPLAALAGPIGSYAPLQRAAQTAAGQGEEGAPHAGTAADLEAAVAHVLDDGALGRFFVHEGPAGLALADEGW